MSSGDDLMGLLASFRNSARYTHVLVLTEHTAEGVTRKRTRIGPTSGQNHPGIQTARQRKRDLLLRHEIPGEVPRKRRSEIPVVRFGIESFLVLPLSRVKVSGLPFEFAVLESPSGCGRHNMDTLEDGAVLQHSTTTDELSQASGVDPPEFGTHSQYRFCFGGKIKGCP